MADPDRLQLSALLVVLLVAPFAGCLGGGGPQDHAADAGSDEAARAPAPSKGAGTSADDADATPAPVSSTETIVVGGTGIGTGALELAAKAYMASHPEVEVEVAPAVGSGGGIKAVQAGLLDWSASARGLKDAEKASGLTFTPVWTDGVAFIAHRDAGVASLTLAQVEGIFHGGITNWKQLGGADLPIQVYTREADDSITKAFMKVYPSLHNATWGAHVNVLNSDPQMYQILGRTRGAVGFTVMTPMRGLGLPVTFIAIDDQVPSAENVRALAYVPALTVGLVKHADLEGAPAAFFDYLASPEGKQVLEAAGYVTLRSDPTM